MRRSKLSPGQILFRVAAGAALVTGCCFNAQSCEEPGRYSHYYENATGDFELKLVWEGQCLPDIEPDRLVNSIAVFKVEKPGDDLLAAEAFCTAERDRIELFDYLGVDGCDLWLAQDEDGGGGVDAGDAGEDDASTGDGGTEDGGAEDGGTEDAGPDDAGPGDAGPQLEPCYCIVGEYWKVSGSDQTAFCEGAFRAVAETVDGSTATATWGQSFVEPPEDPDDDADSGGCCCRAVGS